MGVLIGYRYFPTSIPFMIIEAVMGLFLGEEEGGEMERIL